VYSLAISCDISASPQFRECFQLLGFQSREELLAKLERVLDFLERVPSNLPSKYREVPVKLILGNVSLDSNYKVSAVVFRLVVSCDYM